MGFTWLSLHEYSLMCCLGHGKPINCTNEAFEGLVLLVFAFPMVSRGLEKSIPTGKSLQPGNVTFSPAVLSFCAWFVHV